MEQNIEPSSRYRIFLKVLIILIIGLVVFRIGFALVEAEQAKIIPNQYLSGWENMSDKELVSRINGINPKPFGINGDGLFNESFDDEIAFDSNGLTNIDAHDAIGTFSEELNICLYALGIIPSESDFVKLKSRCIGLAERSATFRYKASLHSGLVLLTYLSG
jgi:hypothetical protein